MTDPKKISLVFSGGSEKGYFQVGAFKWITEAGYAPDRIYGTSVGSLNGAFITNAAARRANEVGHALTTADWQTIAMQLVDYWLVNVRQPTDIALQRSKFADVWVILFNHFMGLCDTAPLHIKIDALLKEHLPAMAAGPIKLKVAAVDYISGDLKYYRPEDPGFISGIKGSIAIPIMMPPAVVQQGGGVPRQVLFDGGVRAVAPLGDAINDGAKDIIAVICQSENLNTDTQFSEGKIMDVAERTQDIVVNQNVNNDVKFIDLINRIITEAATAGCALPSLKHYNLITHTIIRPETALTTDIATFTEAEIRNGIEIGYETAKKMLPAL